MSAKIEAELDARFKAVEPLEKMMATVVQREASVKEREEQRKYLLEEILDRTAEIVLSQEYTFAKRPEGILHSVFYEFSILRHAIADKALVPVPSGSLDDAKKGEGRVEKVIEGGSGVEKSGAVKVIAEEESAQMEPKRAELARKKGKDIVIFEEKRKPQSEKLLSSSLTAHAISTANVQQQIAEDEAIAMALQQDFNLSEKGITEIPLVKPLLAMPSEAGPSFSSVQTPASTLALTTSTIATAPASEKKKMPPPPPPPAPKTQPKQAAPEERDLDPVAKR